MAYVANSYSRNAELNHWEVNQMECSCKGWKKSAEQIFSLQATAAIARDIKYTGDHFKFCPWCGASLVSQSDVEVDAESRDDCTYFPECIYIKEFCVNCKRTT